MLQKIREKAWMVIDKLQSKAEAKNQKKFQKWANFNDFSEKNISDNVVSDNNVENISFPKENWAILMTKPEEAKSRNNKQEITTAIMKNKVVKLELAHKSKVIFSKYKIHLSVGAAAAIVGILAANLFTTSGYQIKVNNKVIAGVEDKVVAEQAIAGYIKDQEKKYNRKVKIVEPITVAEGEVKEISIKSLDEVKEILAQETKLSTEAGGIKINGKVEVVVNNQQECQKILEDLAKPTNLKIEKATTPKTKFRENVEVVSVEASPESVLAADAAEQLIRQGKEKVVTYKIKSGDSLWTIARANDMRVKEILAANPGLNEEKIDIDQVINLNKVEPLINVESVLTTTVSEVIPYNVKVNNDQSMRRGSKKVIQEGTNGAKKVTYELVLLNGQPINKKVVNAVVVKPPKAKVINVGTKWILATRGGGSLAKPARGGYSSYFGPRWGRMHEGVDIDGSTGDPVGAAEEGRVVLAGWHYEYGNAIIIDHGNGIKTLYGHLSSINVSTGQYVSRGQFIGKVGSTGRSTGSHLHFEVRVNGVPVNPMRYL